MGIGLLTTRKPDAKLVGLVKGLTREAAAAHVPLFKTPEFQALLSMLTVIASKVCLW